MSNQNEVSFTVLGKPQGKARPRFVRRGAHVGAYTPKKTVAYERRVREAFLDAAGRNDEPYFDAEPVKAELLVQFEPPKSMGKRKREALLKSDERPCKKPDCDNIAKAVLDALNGIAYKDDSQVVELVVKKTYADVTRVGVRLSIAVNTL